MELAASKAAPRTIYLRAGVHRLSATVVLTAQHNDTTITAYDNETVVVSGGVPIAPAWKAAGNTSSGLPLFVSPVSADIGKFLELFDGGNNTRYVAARYPNGNCWDDAASCNYGLHPSVQLGPRSFPGKH